MNRKIYLVMIVSASVAGMLLRAVCLQNGYEPGSGLPVSGYLPATLLMALTAVVVVCDTAVCVLSFPRRGSRSFERLFGGMRTPGSMVGAVCGALCAVAGGAGLLLLPRQLAEQESEYVQVGTATTGFLALMWALCLISGVSIILLALWQAKGKKATRRIGLFATLPMFWCGVDLVMTYHENSGNPVLSDYSYALLLIIAVMTAFYEMASYLFSASGGDTRRFCAAAGAAVYFAAVNSAGTLLSLLYGGAETLTVGNTIRLWAYLAAGVYLFVQLLHVSKRTQEDS